MGRRAQLFAGQERTPAAGVLYARALDEGAARAGCARRSVAAAAGGEAGQGGEAAARAAAAPEAAGVMAAAGVAAAAGTATLAAPEAEREARATRKAERAARRAARAVRRAERQVAGGSAPEAAAPEMAAPEAAAAPETAAAPEAAAPEAAAAPGAAGGGSATGKRKRERSAEEVEARLQKKERKRQERARAAEEREKLAKDRARQRKEEGGATALPALAPEGGDALDSVPAAAPNVDQKSDAFTGKTVAGTTRNVIREAPKTFSFNFTPSAATAPVSAPAAGTPPIPSSKQPVQTAAADTGGSAPQGAGEGNDPRRLYIGGLPYWCGEKEIRDLLKKFGNVGAVDPLVFPDSGKFRGIAFVSMGSGRAAKRALELDGSDYEGRFLQVRPCTAKPQAPARAAGDVAKTPGYNVAYVGNLPWEADEALLEGFFTECGVTKVRLHTDRETGAFRGFAHVHFNDEAGLDRAVALSGQHLEGREVKVAYAVR